MKYEYLCEAAQKYILKFAHNNGITIDEAMKVAIVKEVVACIE